MGGGWESVFGGADVEGVAEAIACEVEAEERGGEEEGWEGEHPPAGFDVFGAVVDERAP